MLFVSLTFEPVLQLEECEVAKNDLVALQAIAVVAMADSQQMDAAIVALERRHNLPDK